jgi:hypothetical protein
MKPEEVYDDVLYASSAWNDGRPRLCTSVLPQSEGDPEQHAKKDGRNERSDVIDLK